jgi:hypothetical protein
VNPRTPLDEPIVLSNLAKAILYNFNIPQLHRFMPMNIHAVRVSSAVACSLGTLAMQGLMPHGANAATESFWLVGTGEEGRTQEDMLADSTIANTLAIALPDSAPSLPSWRQEDSPVPPMPPSSELLEPPRLDGDSSHPSSLAPAWIAPEQISPVPEGTASNHARDKGTGDEITGNAATDATEKVLGFTIPESTGFSVAQSTQAHSTQRATPEPAAGSTLGAAIEVTVPPPATTPQTHALAASVPVVLSEAVQINRTTGTIHLPPSISPPRYLLDEPNDELTQQFGKQLALANLPSFSPRIPLNLRVVTDNTITSDHPITDSAQSIQEWAERMRRCRGARAILEHVQPDGVTTIPVVFLDAASTVPRIVRNARGNLVCIGA